MGSTLLPDFAACRQAPLSSGEAGPLSGCSITAQTAARVSPAAAGPQPKSLFTCSSAQVTACSSGQESKKSARHCGELPKDRRHCTSLTEECEEKIEVLFRDATVELQEERTFTCPVVEEEATRPRMMQI